MAHNENRIIFSFRARITVVLSLLLLLTLATLQYLNIRAQREVQGALDEQRKLVGDTLAKQVSDITSAMSTAVDSFDRDKFLWEIIESEPVAFEQDRIKHIIIANDKDGRITDSTERELISSKADPTPNRVEVPRGLPKEAGSVAQKGVDPVAQFEENSVPVPTDTYWFRVKTRSEAGEHEYHWIAVVVSTAKVRSTLERSQEDLAATVARTTQERFWTTVGVFALAALVMFVLVWQFTRPVNRLAEAAARVARGDLDFRVGIRRRDEIGQLSETFDDMISGLKAKSELEDRLNNAERAAVIGRLTSAIAHEIRNPLNFINLSIDHVRSKFAPEEPRARGRFEKLLGSIKEETARLNRLVTDVLNFGRPANLNAKAADLRDAVEQVLTLVKPQADSQGIVLDCHLPHEPAVVVTDVEKLKSCISNIVINAVHAMPGGGTLRVAVERIDWGYRMTFADTGQGIPTDALDRVFEPYYSTKETGTGLGLAVTKKIVDEHGGRIRVESHVGLGTTFEIDLPFGDGGDGKPSGDTSELQATVRG